MKCLQQASSNERTNGAGSVSQTQHHYIACHIACTKFIKIFQSTLIGDKSPDLRFQSTLIDDKSPDLSWFNIPMLVNSKSKKMNLYQPSDIGCHWLPIFSINLRDYQVRQPPSNIPYKFKQALFPCSIVAWTQMD